MDKDALRDKIVSWLIDEDHEVKSEPIPPGAPLEWVLSVTAKVPPVIAKIIVQQPSTKKDRIIMTLGVMVSAEHRNKLNSLKPADRISVFSEIIKTIYSICPDCVVVIQPSPVDAQNIIVTKILYHEELNRVVVASNIRKLVNILSVISTILNANLGITPKPQKRDEGFPTSFM
ncbi:MAG: DUF2299 family protein [Desulfurococcales archaeon]|nr:DUF2299 family protein [Desulfurococcales archaeon]MCE4622451.1 DUF2299 family protein [Desulfurococcales archaeon]MCE4627398.1 DUF2299 family protein [Desulfurococcales archaeon]MCE4629233.1 DUF2299 family protein [Desulfurococcales archaeon]